MKKKIALTLLCSAGLLSLAMTANQEEALAHGYTVSPASRGYQGLLEKQINYGQAFQKYGAVINEPQSLEAPKGYPEAGPADGQLASAGGKFEGILDIQTPTYWNKRTDIATGINTFTWEYTANHATSKWHYYMTKPGWDQNAKLTRSEMELIGTVEHDGSSSSTNLSHQVNIPKDRNGYHLIYAVWDIADTSNAFYNVIDVNVKGDSPIPKIPDAPKNIKIVRATDTTITLNWDSQPSVSSYTIYRDGKKIATTTSPVFKDEQLNPESSYTYVVEAVGNNGLISEKSSPVTAKTTASENGQGQVPKAPNGLHSMGKTTNSISLMWNEPEQATEIKEYQVIRDGKVITTTTKTDFNDTGLTAETEYAYTIRAVSQSGLVSEKSNELIISTNSDSENLPGRVWKVGTFSSPELYTAGEEIVYSGKVYKVIQTHNNYGDAGWKPTKTPALFSLK